MSIAKELRELLLARADGRIGAEEFEQQQAALHARLLDQKPAGRQPWLILLAVVAVSAAAVGFYLKQDSHKAAASQAAGTNQMLVPAPVPIAMDEIMPRHENAKKENAGGDLSVMVKRLAAKLEKEPGNVDGWILLARTYGELRQPREAVKAYARADAISPVSDATMLSDWADARVLTNESKWDSESRALVKRALASDPKHLKALALAGSDAFSQADYKQAVIYWKRLQAAAPADSMDVRLAETNIREANDILAGKKPVQAVNDRMATLSDSIPMVMPPGARGK